MTATNHALTGALIGLSLGQPVVAIPVALASHFVLDSIPHFGGDEINKKSVAFRYYLLTEASLCGLLVLILFILKPNFWWLGAICAFVAASPDFMWIKGYVAELKGRRPAKPRYWFVKLHSQIQWFQRPIGAVVELAWAIAALSLLAILLKKVIK